jgi:hypothetical protein
MNVGDNFIFVEAKNILSKHNKITETGFAEGRREMCCPP